MKDKKRTLLAVLLMAVLGLIVVVIYQKQALEDGKLHVVFCDVGQGDAIFITTPDGTDILIDGGPDNKVLGCLSNHMPFWDRTLEMVILTHPHADHLNGLTDVIERYSILYFAGKMREEKDQTEGEKNLHAKLQRKKVPLRNLERGEAIRIGEGSTMQVLWPQKGSPLEADINNSSIVLRLSYKTFDVLLTGDVTLSLLSDLPVSEILKVPHHGSANNLDKDSLDRISAQLAVISVGDGNRFGHPHGEVIRLLGDRGIRVLRTDQDGEVEVVSDGKKWWVKTSD